MKQRAVQRLLCGHTALPAPVLLPSLLLAHEPQQRLAITFLLHFAPAAVSPVACPWVNKGLRNRLFLRADLVPAHRRAPDPRSSARPACLDVCCR